MYHLPNFAQNKNFKNRNSTILERSNEQILRNAQVLILSQNMLHLPILRYNKTFSQKKALSLFCV